MSNASTVRRQVSGTQQLTIAPLVGAIITTTETAFQLNNNGLTLTGGGVIPLSAGVTGLYAGTGQVLHVRGTGIVAGESASGTVILKLYEVTAAAISAGLTSALVVSAGNAVATSATTTTTHASSSFTFDARLQLDAAGNLLGQFTSEIDNQISIWADTTAVTGLVGEADLNFVLTAKLGTTTAAVVVTLNEFAIDLE